MAQIYQELHTKRGILRGYLHKPEGMNCPLVIMYHGFRSSKQENRFLFVQFSRFLDHHHIASLRFDFIGSGESDGDFKDMTLSHEVEEALAIFDYAQSLSFVESISVLGLSMGGVVATQVAKLRSTDTKKMLLWAPAITLNHFGMTFKTARENGTAIYDAGGIELSDAFIDDLLAFDLTKGIESFTNPVLICQGTKDDYVPIEASQKYLSIFTHAHMEIFEGSNHTFNKVVDRLRLFQVNMDFLLDSLITLQN